MRTYNWTRFWCLREGSLWPSRGYLSFFPGLTKDVVTFEQISHLPCLALLGEPGIGKSYALQKEVENLERRLNSNLEGEILFFNLRSYSSETRLIHEIFGNETLGRWLSGSHSLHLFLDSLDEGLLRIDTLSALLIDKLKTLPIERLNFRVACRTAEWSTFLEENLKKIWGDNNFRAYELVSLRESDVSMAAKTEGLEPEAFVSEVAAKGAEPLAAKPMTLRLLLNLFRPPNALPRSQAELYERGCLLLCEEDSERRKAKWKLTARQRFRVAARIAAVTIFGNKASIWVGSDTGEQGEADVSVSEIAGGFEKDADGVDFHVTENVVRETLSATGLFTSRGLNRLGWQHQTYAEFFAAWYLNTLNLDNETILNILRNSDNAEGLLVPQLYETAAWLASERAQIFEILMQTEPLVLLRSDVLSADDVVRSDLTAALLNVFEEERELDRWGIRSYYSKLKHAGLANQLRPCLTDKSKGFLVRRVAMDIAEECQVQSLQNELANIALDRDEKLGIRASAADAVCEIADSQTRARLKPLALGEAGEDPESELKGYGLMCVWPEHITAEELFNTLTGEPNLFGSYKSFLNRRLIPGLKTEDLPVALDWVKNVTKNHGVFDFDRKAVAAEILWMAWEALDDEHVLNSFVQVVLKKIRQYDELLEPYDAREKLLAMRQDTRKRRSLLLRIFPLLGERTDWFGIEHSIVLRLGNEDVPWLLDELLTTTDLRTQDILISVLKDFLNSWHGVEPDVLTKIHSAIDQSDVVRRELSVFFEPMYLDSPSSMNAREAYEKRSAQRKSEDADEEDEPLTPSASERVLSMLEKFERGDVDAWWQLNLEMTLTEGSKFYGNELEVDLTKLPGWTNASEETQTRIIDAARKYVLIGNPKAEEWIGTNTLYRPAFSGYRALWLLRDMNSSFADSLSTDVWRKWAPIVFHYPIYNGSGEEVYGAHRRFIAAVHRIVPDETVRLLLEEIDRFGSPNNVVDFEKVQDCWDEPLLTALRAKLIESDLHPQMFRRILTSLIEHNDRETVSYAHELLKIPIPTEEPAQDRAIVAASALLLYSEKAGWDSVWLAITSNPAFGRKVIESVVSPYRSQVITQLSEEKVGDFYLWLSRNYPHSEDPQFPAGIAHVVGTREEVGQLRDSLLNNLKERGTPESVQAIQEIAVALPHLEWLKWTLLEARKNMRRHSWKPLLPAKIIGLRESAETLETKKSSGIGTPAGGARSLSLWGSPVDEIPNLDDLVRSYRSHADRFTFFVGAGLAVPVFPLWDELLLRMINKCDSKKVLATTDKNELLELLNQKKDFLDIATVCVRALEKHEYRAFMTEQFDHDIDITKLPAYQELIKLRPNTIVTTNFDQIPDRLNGLSFSFEATAISPSSSYYNVYAKRNVAEAKNDWRNGKPIVFKMHGCIKDHDSLIFTREDFRREINVGYVKEFIKAIFSSQTVVFLGFGFSDPHIDSILSFLYEIDSGLTSPHYVLAPDLTSIRKKILERKYGVRIINYDSTPGHPEVVDFIRFIRGLA